MTKTIAQIRHKIPHLWTVAIHQLLIRTASDRPKFLDRMGVWHVVFVGALQSMWIIDAARRVDRNEHAVVKTLLAMSRRVVSDG